MVQQHIAGHLMCNDKQRSTPLPPRKLGTISIQQNGNSENYDRLQQESRSRK
jgi:hypothetical protein